MHEIRRPAVFDCVMFNGETEVLLIRLHELATVADRFVIVEANVTFSGQPRDIAFNPADPRINPFAASCRHIVVADMPATDDPWQREKWQRNAVLRGLADAGPDDLIIMSDVDEIPRAAVVRQMRDDRDNTRFGLELDLFYFFADYWNAAGPEAATPWSVAARRRELDSITPDALRYAVRDRGLAARIMPDAGWHFSYLMDLPGIRRKIGAFSHQEFNNEAFLASLDIEALVRRGGDLYNRPAFVWGRYDPRHLPAWLQANRDTMDHLFTPERWLRQP